MFVLREIHPRDLDELLEVAAHLDTLNLPADRSKLELLIDFSRRSFSEELPPHRRDYVFAMMSGEQLVGTCMIIGQHGTFERPAVYFDVVEEQKYSSTLGKHFIHQVLELSFEFDGATEIGGLVLNPDFRGHPMKLGKLLSFVRFLFIGIHRSWFRDEIVAELLPQLNPDGTSDLWECLGAQFTEVGYREADRLSRESIEFVRNLFPQTPIYTALLPSEVSEKIGVVGEPTKPVEKMLRNIGFEWNHSIDPFDGGPTFVCSTEDCRMVQRTHRSTMAGLLTGPGEGRALVASERERNEIRFRAVLAAYERTPEGYLLDAETVDELKISEGDEIAILPLSGDDIEDFWRGRDDDGEWTTL